MIKRISMLALAAMLAAAPLLAHESRVDGKIGGGPFRLDPPLDGILLGTAVGLDGAVFYLDEVEKANQTDFNGTLLDASQVNEFDRLLMNPYSRELEHLGTGLSIAAVLMPAVSLAVPRDEWITGGTMYAETMLISYGLKELGKLCVARARRYMYFDGFPRDAVDDGDWGDSFPSGHTTLAFAGASFASYVFCEYLPDSRMKIPVILSSYALALGTAACRIAGGSHFMTDVIVGAAIGTACGLFIPWLHTLGSGSENSAEAGRKVTVRAMPTTGMLISIKY